MIDVLERVQNPPAYDWAISQGYSSITSQIIGRRLKDAGICETNLLPTLGGITNPSKLPDVDKACERILQNILSESKIYCAVDYDNDGVSSGAILYRGLTEVFGVDKTKVELVSGVRFTEGYGLSKGLAERIYAGAKGEPTLVVTADMGSSDEDRIKWLKERCIDVVVTDHHEIPLSGIPASAVAVVNPTRSDSEFGDPLIAGCGVAWFLLARLVKICTDRGICGFIDKDSVMRRKRLFVQLTSFACSGTIGDCVSLSRSVNNRALCRAGLYYMRKGTHPCWRAFATLLQEGDEIDSSHIAFSLSPMSNACGRLVRADAALAFLICNDDATTLNLLTELQKENEERKRIEAIMRESAVTMAEDQYNSGRTCAVIYLEDGHPGVQGICASRVVETFGKPTCIFSKKGDGTTTITASLRSVNGIDIKAALDYAFNNLPVGTPKTYGGHYFAAGTSIDHSLLEMFSQLLNTACEEMAKNYGSKLAPVIEYDGCAEISDLDCESIKELKSIGPYGREFPLPCFKVAGTVANCALIGKEKNHLKLRLTSHSGGGGIDCIYFFVDRLKDFQLPVNGQRLELYGEPQENWFRGRCRAQLIVKTIQPTFAKRESS